MGQRLVIDSAFYHQNVMPRLEAQQRETFFAKYPHCQLNKLPSLAETPIIMLVALTGTGKTTTLKRLSEKMTIVHNLIPSRRDLADMVIIPTAQVIAEHDVHPVIDRVQRFEYTRLFANYVTGGYAEAYQWFNLSVQPTETVICEGIRGHHEIVYVLEHTPKWHIIELSANPLTRLFRLSNRADAFDKTDAGTTLDFLPEVYHDAVRDALKDGKITRQALTIMQSEAQNYGLMPYNQEHPRYQLIQTDDVSPETVAQQVEEAILAWQK